MDHSSVAGDALESGALLAECRIGEGDLLRSHPHQSLNGVPAFVVRCWNLGAGPYARGGADSMIVLAVDGVGYDTARDLWSPDLLIPITSTFPSTSSTAWLTATTGLPVERHLVAGVVYFDPDAGALYNCLSGRYLSDGAPDAGRAAEPRLGPWPTYFSELSARGVECVANLGDLCSLPRSWSDAVAHGARVEVSDHDWGSIRLSVETVVEIAIAEIERSLAARDRRRPLLVWTYVNLDEYVHHHGYDARIARCLRQLEKAVRGWSSRGHLVLAHSDHGLVRSDPADGTAAALETLADPSLCERQPGGAGRVLWGYPRPGLEAAMARRLAEQARGWGRVLRADELESLGIARMNAELKRRIGEVVLLATGHVFPCIGEARPYEHGSLLPEEMLAPLAVWSAS